MTRNLMACIVLGGSLLAYGCATQTGGGETGGQGLTIQQMIQIGQTGLSVAHVGLDSYCGGAKHLPFCNDPRLMGEIEAGYTAAQNSLTSLNTVLNTQGSTQDQIQAAVTAFLQAVNDYTNVVDSFKHGKKPTAHHVPMTRAEMLGHIQALTDRTRSETNGI